VTVAPVPGSHGGDGARLAAALGIGVDDVLDLSASLNPCAPDVAAAVARHVDSVRRYPDATAATEALAAAIDVDPARLVLTNGGSEAIALVAAQLGVGRVDAPEFSLYERHLSRLDPAAGAWRSNPNNPTGLLALVGAEAAVWDEAFWPLATGTWTRGDADRGAIVVGSVTKVWACPGLRLGYLLAPDDDVAAGLRTRQSAWAVNGLAAAVMAELLAATDLPSWRDAIARLRAELVALLRGAGFEPAPSDAPWVLVPGAGDARERLAQHAVLVRDCASFGLTDTVRVAVPDERGLERLAAALAG
jgi:histidinol-phosphate/aromatic aminotransferase/cobyric acid decarboxylase-like protein